MSREKILSSVEKGFIQISAFVIAFVAAFISSQLLHPLIRPSNPDAIKNLYVQSGFSPEQNFATIIWLIVFSLGFYALLNYFISTKIVVYKIVVVIFAVLSILSINILPTLNNYVGNLDTFHNGEQLAPANDFNAGKNLFSGMFVLHGAGEDVILPSIALKMSNNGAKHTGIGTYYFLTTVFDLISATLFIILVWLIFRRTSVFIAITGWFTFGVYSNFYLRRDIFVWLTLVIAFYLLTRVNIRYKTYLYLGLGAVSSSAVLYALDRGIIALFIAGIVTVITLFSTTNSKGKSTVRVPNKLRDFSRAALIVAGVVIIQLLALLLVGAGPYKDFLQTYAIDIPKYQGLLFNWPLPSMSQDRFLLWLPVVLAPITIMMLYKLIRNYGLKALDSRILFAIVLVLTGILFLRSGYGRSDWSHIAYSTPVLFLGIFYTTLLYVQKYYQKTELLWLPFLTLILLFVPAPTLSFDRLSTATNTSLKQVATFITMPFSSDEKWTPRNVQQVTSFLKNNTSSKDPVFVFTQQPIYYYLSDRRNPTRFYIPWFADPKPLENEMLSSLKKNNPKYIVYSSGTGWDHVDGYTMQQRTPSVNAWIMRTYPNTIKIGDVTLLSK